MSRSDKLPNMKSLYVWGFPINFSLELFIQFVSLLIPVYLVRKSIDTGSLLLASLNILLAIYFYPLTILLLSALATRLLPKPKLGYLTEPGDKLKFQTLIALNTFVRRTPARWLLVFPFPGYFFYKLSGLNISPSALITSPDSIQDVYLVSIGNNTVLGWGCLVLGHYSGDGINTLLGKVVIGDNVLIGEQATIWPNVKIGEGAIIQNKSVVQYGSIIPANEIWGGIPAKKIKNRNNNIKSTSLPIKQDMEKYIQELLLSNYNLRVPDKNIPLISLGLTIEDISRIFKKLENRYKNLLIDRTDIGIETLTFNVFLSKIYQRISE